MNSSERLNQKATKVAVLMDLYCCAACKIVSNKLKIGRAMLLAYLSHGMMLTKSKTMPVPSEFLAQTGCEKG